MRNITSRNPAMDSRDIEDGIMALLKGDKEMAAVLFDRGFVDGPMRHRIARAVRNAA